MRRRSVAIGLALVAALAPACSTGDGDDAAFRLDLDGRATIVGEGGDERDVDSGRHSLEPGDTVRVVDGDGVLELPGEPEVLLREATVVVAGRAPEIVDGEAVVVADDGDVGFSVANVEVELSRGAARVHRGLGVTVGLYRGEAVVRSAGRTFDGGLPALRQLTIPATGLLPRTAVPLVYDADDPDRWDRRFIGDAIALGRYLDTLSRGFTTQLGPRLEVSASLLAEVLPSLADEPAFGDALVGDADRSAGEALVGAAIVVESGAGPFVERWSSVFGFRADGAPWGLVALDQAVRRDALRGTLEAAIGRSPLLFAVGTTVPTTTTTTTTTTSPTPPPSTTTTTQPDDGDEPPGPLPTIPPIGPGDDPSDDPSDDGNIITELLDDLLP